MVMLGDSLASGIPKAQGRKSAVPPLCRFGPYFVSPVIAGLEPDGSVYLAGTDSIGAIETAKDFMVSGTAPESLMGVCEAMWRPGLVRAALLTAANLRAHGRCCAACRLVHLTAVNTYIPLPCFKRHVQVSCCPIAGAGGAV